MARGQVAADGTARVAANGYHYVKQDGKWRLTHHITAEKKLGRRLREDETVRFISPKFKRDPNNPDGIMVIKKKTASLRRRRAQIEVRIQELQAELEYIDREIGEA